MTSLTMRRRRFLQNTAIAAGTVLASPYIGSRVNAAASQLVWAGWGGDYQEQQSKAFGSVLTKETGIKVVEVSNYSQVAGIKAQVENNNPEWDLAEPGMVDSVRLKKQGFLAEIAYDEATRRDYPNLDPHIASLAYNSWVLGWNTESFPGDNHPKTWADFWDVKRFPGPRTMCAWNPEPNIEIALLADGVAKKDIYPLTDAKVDRAFKKLEELRPHIHVWWNAGGQSQQLFSDGEVVLGMVFDGRVRGVKNSGAPVEWTFNEGVLAPGGWVIPKSSKNVEAASKLINVALRPETQAEYVRLSKYGATNPKAYDLLKPSERDRIGGYGPNVAVQLHQDVTYWVDNMSSHRERWDKLISGK